LTDTLNEREVSFILGELGKDSLRLDDDSWPNSGQKGKPFYELNIKINSIPILFLLSLLLGYYFCPLESMVAIKKCF
jgi:hypothetical protein